MSDITKEDELTIDKLLEDEDKMEIEMYLSTDGKHTVHVKATEGLVTEAYTQAKKIYDQILKDYGKGTVQKVIEEMDSGDVPTCPEHHIAMKLHPAGISKRTGKPYNAFWTCPVEDCKRTENA